MVSPALPSRRHRGAAARAPAWLGAVRLGAVLAVAFVLVSGLAGGLLRAGFALPASSAAGAHAALMIGGFFGTVIGIERAVALRLRWAWLAPAASVAGGWCLALGAHRAGAVLLAAASLAFSAASLQVLRRQRAAHTLTLLIAALAWLAGNLAWLGGLSGDGTLALWFAFLVLTIAAERLEMTRLMRRRPGASTAFALIVALLLGALALVQAAPREGGLAFGAALVLLAAWLALFDMARVTVRSQGLSRYMALALLTGYGWLGIGGVAWAASAFGLPARDAALHALGLGFIFSMVMAHAPVILPAVAGIKVRFGAAFYAPLTLLHLSLALRLALGWDDARWQALGALLNVAALALFALTMVGAAVAERHRPRPSAGTP